MDKKRSFENIMKPGSLVSLFIDNGNCEIFIARILYFLRYNWFMKQTSYITLKIKMTYFTIMMDFYTLLHNIA